MYIDYYYHCHYYQETQYQQQRCTSKALVMDAVLISQQNDKRDPIKTFHFSAKNIRVIAPVFEVHKIRNF